MLRPLENVLSKTKAKKKTIRAPGKNTLANFQVKASMGLYLRS